MLFALPLSGLWNSGVSEYPTVMAGLFPLTDGSNYYTDARRVLEEGRLNVVSSSRPLFPGVLATLLAVSGQNLQFSIAALGAIAGVACGLLIQEARQAWGAAAALVTLIGLFSFYRRFIGTVWTEHWGLTLGAIAAAVLWRSVQRRQPALFFLGLLLLTLGLAARAGAFFVLPALIGWGTYFFRTKSNGAVRFAIWGMGVVAIGFILNQAVLNAIGRPDLAFSNYAYTVYAQVVDSSDWRQVLIDHPDVAALTQPVLSRQIYSLALQALVEHPLAVFRHAGRAWLTYFSPTAEGAWGFIATYGATPLTTAMLWGFYLLSLLGLLVCLKPPTPFHSMVLTAYLGVVASIPFVPPWMDGVPASLRIYAATLPLTSLLAAVGITVVLPRRLALPRLANRSPLLWSVAIALILLTTTGAIAAQTVYPTPSLPPAPCDGTSIRFHPRSVVNVVANQAMPHTQLPQIRVADWQRQVEQVRRSLAQRQSILTDQIRTLATVTPGQTVIQALALKDQTPRWIVVETGALPTHAAIVTFCGQQQNEVLFAQSVYLLPKGESAANHLAHD